MTHRVIVAGIGMIPFATPSRSQPHGVMAEAAARAALVDAGLEYTAIQQAYVGYVYGDSTSGQSALYGLGQTGIPIVNVNNNCSTGSTALWMARQAVETGAADCILALGFEQMQRGALGSVWTDRPSPLTRFDDITKSVQGWDNAAPMAAQYFGGAGRQYAEKYGTKDSR